MRPKNRSGNAKSGPLIRALIVLIGSWFLTIALPLPAGACKCTAEIRYGIDVNSLARSHIYCGSEGSEGTFTECIKLNTPPALCQAGFGWICPLGPSSGAQNSSANKLEHWIGYGFEAVFTFRDLDDFLDCDFGQGLQYTLIDASGEKAPKNPHKEPTGKIQAGSRIFTIENGTTFPRFGATDSDGNLVFGSDNYTRLSPGTTIDLNSGPSGRVILRWADMPSIFLSKKDVEKGAQIQDRVLVFAKPKESQQVSCACVFKFAVSSEKGSTEIGEWIADSEGGVNCLYTAVGSF